MNNLTTRKIALGLLMGLVLAFSVQGIADALTFGTSRSGDLQTASERQEFKITFSVSLASNTTAINNGELVSDDGTRIDSSGYLVFDASDGNAYRTTSTSRLIWNLSTLSVEMLSQVLGLSIMMRLHRLTA